MDRPTGFRPQPVDRTPYGAFATLAGAVVGGFVVTSWLLGVGIGYLKKAHIRLPGISLPNLSAPAPSDVVNQVQDALNQAAQNAARSAVDSASQAAKDEAAKQLESAKQSTQDSIRQNLQNGLK